MGEGVEDGLSCSCGCSDLTVDSSLLLYPCIADAHAEAEEMRRKSKTRPVTGEDNYVEAKAQITGFLADCQDDITEMKNKIGDAVSAIDSNNAGGSGNDEGSGKKRKTVKELRLQMKRVKEALREASDHNDHLKKQVAKLHHNVAKHCEIFDHNRKVNLKAEIDEETEAAEGSN